MCIKASFVGRPAQGRGRLGSKAELQGGAALAELQRDSRLQVRTAAGAPGSGRATKPSMACRQKGHCGTRWSWLAHSRRAHEKHRSWLHPATCGAGGGRAGGGRAGGRQAGRGEGVGDRQESAITCKAATTHTTRGGPTHGAGQHSPTATANTTGSSHLHGDGAVHADGAQVLGGARALGPQAVERGGHAAAAARGGGGAGGGAGGRGRGGGGGGGPQDEVHQGGHLAVQAALRLRVCRGRGQAAQVECRSRRPPGAGVGGAQSSQGKEVRQQRGAGTAEPRQPRAPSASGLAPTLLLHQLLQLLHGAAQVLRALRLGARARQVDARAGKGLAQQLARSSGRGGLGRILGGAEAVPRLCRRPRQQRATEWVADGREHSRGQKPPLLSKRCVAKHRRARLAAPSRPCSSHRCQTPPRGVPARRWPAAGATSRPPRPRATPCPAQGSGWLVPRYLRCPRLPARPPRPQAAGGGGIQLQHPARWQARRWRRCAAAGR